MTSILTLPLLGETMETGRVAQWLKQPGQSFRRGETIVEIETDKTVVELPAVNDGTLVEILAEAGTELKIGEPLCRIDGDAPAAGAVEDVNAPLAAEPMALSKDEPKETRERTSQDATARRRARATPLARRLARERGLEIAGIAGTGRRARIEARDVVAVLDGKETERPRGEAMAPASGDPGAGPSVSAEQESRQASGATAAGLAHLPGVPAVDYAKFGPVEPAPLSRIQRISGPRLHAAWINVPHVTHYDEADITDLDMFRKALDQQAKVDESTPYRISYLPFLIKAAVVALKAFPTFNSALAATQDGLIRRLYWHIGVAIDTPEGLVVAVVRDADRKGLFELARELALLSSKAREGRLSLAELQGGTFTISSLGGIGGSAFTPIVNAPEVAILGVARARMWPVWDGKAFQPRLMLPLCLSYDHRVIDGAAAARFMRHLCAAIEDVRRMLY